MTKFKKLEGLKSLFKPRREPLLQNAYDAAMAVPIGEKSVVELAEAMYAANSAYWDNTLKLGPRSRPWGKAPAHVRDTWLTVAQSRIEKERSTT